MPCISSASCRKSTFTLQKLLGSSFDPQDSDLFFFFCHFLRIFWVRPFGNIYPMFLGNFPNLPLPIIFSILFHGVSCRRGSAPFHSHFITFCLWSTLGGRLRNITCHLYDVSAPFWISKRVFCCCLFFVPF